jgi:4-amino-4-deoxy-L-arabinose transferase-like glycosyltransferase
MNKKFTLEYISLSIILILAFGLRLYKIDIPLADHHSWRQADTAAVARNFVKEGFDLLRPRIDNMAPVARPDLENPNRFFFTDFPFYNAIVAGLYKFFGVREFLGRLVSVFASLGTLVFIYLLTKEVLGKKIALLAVFFFAVLPFSFFFARVILPEPTMLFFSTGMLCFLTIWTRREKRLFFLLACLFGALALLVKAFAIFLILPAIYLFWQKGKFKTLLGSRIFIFLFLTLFPLVLWRLWMQQYPEGVPASGWLFNENNIRFKGAFFRWIFAERFGKLILGYWGLVLFGPGLIVRPNKKEGWFFYIWLGAVFSFFTVFAAGNVTHDYYQIMALPIVCIFLAKGANFLIVAPKKIFNRVICYLLFTACFLFMLAFSWYEVRGFYNLQGRVDLAGQAVDRLVSEDALVLTGDTGDVTLLYNTNRHGWSGGYASVYPNTPEIIEKIRTKGGQFYVTTKVENIAHPENDFGRYMFTNYKVVEQTENYAIFDLRR